MQGIKTSKLINPLIDDVLDVLDFNVVTHLRSSEEHRQTFLDRCHEFFPVVHNSGAGNPV